MRLVSKCASLRLAPSPSARLLACLTCLRLASGPAQPATRHPGSGPSVYETGLAHPATRPSTAQPSPPSPSSSSVVRLPHPWLRSLVAETSFRPSTTSNPPQPPARAPAHLSACQPLGRPQLSPARSGLSETGSGQRLVSSYASCFACLTCPSPSVRLPKQLSPGWPGLDLLLASTAKSRLVSKYA